MRIVFFTGAGVSAESGLRTFRDSDGLWEQYRITDVATPEAFARDPEMVLRFYELRRQQVLQARPNAAHMAIAGLEDVADVRVVTQNIDDLHERAGSSHVMHLHGEILKAQSSDDPSLVVPVPENGIRPGDLCPLGSQLRPHVVWFGEDVPMLGPAAEWMAGADLVVVVGSSLQVWPAAGLVHHAPPRTPVHVVDPAAVEGFAMGGRPVTYWKEAASMGVPMLANLFRQGKL